MIIPKIENLNHLKLIDEAKKLTAKGRLAISNNHLVYLNINDDYIHQLFPFLEHLEIKKPAYFNAGSVGAHVSVIYPEEKTLIDSSDVNREHCFEIIQAFSTKIGMKKYVGLMVSSPSLLDLRRKYGLHDQLPFKGHLIDFHITVGVQSLVDTRPRS